MGSALLPPISVVVIGRNEGERLRRCLESVRAADYPPDRLQLIYVDSNSTDGSCALAESFRATVITLKLLRPTAAAARNAGLHAASHDFIQFLDGDTVLNPDWLKRGVETLTNTKYSCVFGRLEEIHPDASIYNWWGHFDWHFPPGPVEACGGVAVFRRDMLLRTGGFDANLIAGEERDLCHRLVHRHGGSILSLDQPMVLHDLDLRSFRQYWQRCVRSGHSYAEVSSRYDDLHSWRYTCRRNFAHAAIVVVAMATSFAFWSWWPITGCLAFVLTIVIRNGWRCRRRLGGLGAGFLYAVHHYISKLPTVIGHVDFHVRRALKGRARS